MNGEFAGGVETSRVVERAVPGRKGDSPGGDVGSSEAVLGRSQEREREGEEKGERKGGGGVVATHGEGLVG